MLDERFCPEKVLPPNELRKHFVRPSPHYSFSIIKWSGEESFLFTVCCIPSSIVSTSAVSLGIDKAFKGKKSP